MAESTAPALAVPAGGGTLGRAARGSALNLGGSVISAVANLGLTVMITRLVSSEDAGVFFSATSLFLLAVAVSQLGTSTGLVYFLSRARARGELRHARSYMRTAMVPVLTAAVVIGGLVFFLAQPLGELLSPGRESEFAGYMRVMAAFIPCAAALQLALAATQGLGTMRPFAVVDHVYRSLLHLVLVGLALMVFHDDAVALYWSMAYLPTAVVAWVWWQRLRDRAADQVKDPDLRPAGPFWRFSAPRALANVTQVAMQRLDIILVGALAGLGAAAIYAAATRLLVLGQMIARAVAMSGQPLLGESLARPDRSEARHLYRVTTGWLVAVTWPWYLTLMVWGPVLLLIFGEDYTIGHFALVILCGAMLFATSCGMVDMVLNMGGRSLWNLLNVVIAFTVNIVLDLVLIPQLGLLGAAIGWGAAIVLANLLPLVQVWPMLKMNPYGKGTLGAAAGAAICFGVVPVGFGALMGWSVSSFVWSSVIAVALYAPALWFLRRTLELDVFTKALRRRRPVVRPAP